MPGIQESWRDTQGRKFILTQNSYQRSVVGSLFLVEKGLFGRNLKQKAFVLKKTNWKGRHPNQDIGHVQQPPEYKLVSLLVFTPF